MDIAETVPKPAYSPETDRSPIHTVRSEASYTHTLYPHEMWTTKHFVFGEGNQRAGETADIFYTRLQHLASTLEFTAKDGEMKSQIIRGCMHIEPSATPCNA